MGAGATAHVYTDGACEGNPGEPCFRCVRLGKVCVTEERKRHSDEMASMAARLEAEQLQAAQICAIEPVR